LYPIIYVFFNSDIIYFYIYFTLEWILFTSIFARLLFKYFIVTCYSIALANLLSVIWFIVNIGYTEWKVN